MLEPKRHRRPRRRRRAQPLLLLLARVERPVADAATPRARSRLVLAQADADRRPTRLGRDLLFDVETVRPTPARRPAGSTASSAASSSPSTSSRSTFPGGVSGSSSERYEVPASVTASARRCSPCRSSRIAPGSRSSVDSAKSPVVLGTGVPWSAVLSGRRAKARASQSVKIAGLTARSVVRTRSRSSCRRPAQLRSGPSSRASCRSCRRLDQPGRAAWSHSLRLPVDRRLDQLRSTPCRARPPQTRSCS